MKRKSAAEVQLWRAFIVPYFWIGTGQDW